MRNWPAAGPSRQQTSPCHDRHMGKMVTVHQHMAVPSMQTYRLLTRLLVAVPNTPTLNSPSLTGRSAPARAAADHCQASPGRNATNREAAKHVNEGQRVGQGPPPSGRVAGHSTNIINDRFLVMQVRALARLCQTKATRRPAVQDDGGHTTHGTLKQQMLLAASAHGGTKKRYNAKPPNCGSLSRGRSSMG